MSLARTACSDADHATIVSGDDDRGRSGATWAAIALVARPQALQVGQALAFLTRVLDVDEQCTAARRFGHAGDLAALGADEKATQFCFAQGGAHKSLLRAGLLHTVDHHPVLDCRLAAVTHLPRQGGQHHAVGFVGHGAVVRLDPADTGGRAEPEAIRRREGVFGRQPRQVGIACILFGTKKEDVPAEGRGRGRVTVFTEADDVAIGIARALLAIHIGVGPRVGRIHTARGAVGFRVVGQGDIDLAVFRVHGCPFRSVHLGRAYCVCGMAGVEVDLALVVELEAAVVGDARVPDRQLNPLATAIGIEAGHVELALVEVFVTGYDPAADVLRIPDGGGDEFIDVFVAGIATHIERQRLPRLGQAAGGTFVGQAPHADALGRRGCGVEWIDLDVIAKGIGLVAEIALGIGPHCGQVPARKTVICG